MSKTIRIKLNTRSINNAIKQIEAYKNRLVAIRTTICEELAKIGMKEAEIRFANAQYDGVNDSCVTIEQTENGYKVVANGNAVAFIEFGAGVHYNPAGGAYPIAKPSGISPIGGYGKKQGRKDSWRYKGDPGTNGNVIEVGGEEWVVTQGNPAQMPMYHALNKMQNEVERIVKEAFKNA